MEFKYGRMVQNIVGTGFKIILKDMENLYFLLEIIIKDIGNNKNIMEKESIIF